MRDKMMSSCLGSSKQCASKSIRVEGTIAVCPVMSSTTKLKRKLYQTDTVRVVKDVVPTFSAA